MSISIGALEFEEPMSDLDQLNDAAGIFAIFSSNGEDLELIEFGEDESVRSCIQKHQENNDWTDLEIAVSVHYTPELSGPDRQELTRTLERELNSEVAA